MGIGIYPGSFDPLTNGHLDIIERATTFCDKLYIAIALNSAKKPLFTIDERIEILNTCCRDEKIEVVSFEGLLAEYCKQKGVSFIVRGIRSVLDYEYERTIALVNSSLYPEIETLFMMSRGEYSHVSSNIVKEVASYQGNIASFVPPIVLKRVQQKFSA
jgi:pantetheine-phosphate adenylyltransferase